MESAQCVTVRAPHAGVCNKAEDRRGWLRVGGSAMASMVEEENCIFYITPPPTHAFTHDDIGLEWLALVTSQIVVVSSQCF